MLQSNGKKHSDRWALGWTAFFLFFWKMKLKTAQTKNYRYTQGLTAWKYECWTPQFIEVEVRFFFALYGFFEYMSNMESPRWLLIFVFAFWCRNGWKMETLWSNLGWVVLDLPFNFWTNWRQPILTLTKDSFNFVVPSAYHYFLPMTGNPVKWKAILSWHSMFINWCYPNWFQKMSLQNFKPLVCQWFGVL